MAEQAVISSGLDYTIFRPSIIYGPGGEFINMLMRQVRLSPFVPVIGNGRYRMQPVSVKDVARLFVDSLTNKTSVNNIYEVGGPEQLSYNAMIDTVAVALGKRRLKLRLPVALARIVASLSEAVAAKPMLTRDQINMLLAGSAGDIGPARRDFGFDPLPFREGLAALL